VPDGASADSASVKGPEKASINLRAPHASQALARRVGAVKAALKILKSRNGWREPSGEPGTLPAAERPCRGKIPSKG
jgi:hypothetical protein